MKRALYFLALMLLTSPGSAAGGVLYLDGPMPRFGAALGVPPAGFTAAPMPSQDVFAPREQQLAPGEPSFGARLNNHTQQLRSGAGYGPGANFSEELLRKNRAGLGGSLAPSLELKVLMDK